MTIEKFVNQQQLILFQACSKALQSLNKYCNAQQILIGIELEFYLLNSLNEVCSIDEVNHFINYLEKNNFLIQRAKIKKEQGSSQLEISTKPYFDLSQLCNDLQEIKKIIIEGANLLAFNANFSGQIFSDDCGNSLQFNISLIDKNSQNLFAKNQNLVAFFSSLLLDYSLQMLFILAPFSKDYKRFELSLNKNLFKAGKYTAPVNLSFGNDNRTCAIRVPRVDDLQNTRIEYRIASASCNHYLALSAILLALSQIELQKKIYQQIYGNAFDQDNYSLMPLKQDLESAKKIFFDNDNFFYQQFLAILKIK